MRQLLYSFKKLSLQIKLILIGLVPTLFFLYVSFQYYQTEKQKLVLLHNNIRLINRAAAVNKLIEQLRIERDYGYEYALKHNDYGICVNQWKYTDSAITVLERTDSELRDIKTYTLLDGLAEIRASYKLKHLVPDAVNGYYTTAILRISYLNVTPELLMGNTGQVNQDIQGQKILSEMNIYLANINSNIYNLLYTHNKNAAGTLNGLVGLYQVYNTFDREFLLKSSPASILIYNQIKQQSALKSVTRYLDNVFKRMTIDNTYNDTQWWKISGEATGQLKQLQAVLAARVSQVLANLQASEEARVNHLLILLIVSIALIIGVLSYTISDISARLNELRIAAEKIAVGDTDIILGDYTDDVIGRLAASVARIDENNKMLAQAAAEIGSGNFDVHVKARGDTDLLGNAVLKMQNELQRFTREKLEQAAEMEDLFEVIKQSETHFRQIADQSPFMIWQVNNQGDAIYVNLQWLDFTGMSFNDSVGLSWMKAMHPDDQKDRAFVKAFADRVPYRSKARFKNASGEYRWMYIQGNPIFNKEFEGFIGSLTDITDQLAAENALIELIGKKDEFLSIASHELKTPLTSIKAYAQLLHKNANPDDKQYPFVSKMLLQIARLEKLTRDLLDVSRINSGRMDYDLEPVEFGDLLKQCIENFGDVFNGHQLIVKNSARGTIMADKVRIEQVFNNLLNNAAKYSPDADTILLNSFEENGDIVVTIQDFGIGIAKKELNLLFERFYRSEKTSNKFQGLGLGLFISAEIIKRHGGEIWVESELGNGSVFYFKLPVTKKRLEVEN